MAIPFDISPKLTAKQREEAALRRCEAEDALVNWASHDPQEAVAQLACVTALTIERLDQAIAAHPDPSKIWTYPIDDHERARLRDVNERFPVDDEGRRRASMILETLSEQTTPDELASAAIAALNWLIVVANAGPLL